MFFDKHLKFIQLNEQSIAFSKLDLTYLLQSNYDSQFLTHVYSVPVVTAGDVKRNELPSTVDASGPVRIMYHTKDSYRNAAKLLGLMDDFKVILSSTLQIRQVKLALPPCCLRLDVILRRSISAEAVKKVENRNNGSSFSYNYYPASKQPDLSVN